MILFCEIHLTEQSFTKRRKRAIININIFRHSQIILRIRRSEKPMEILPLINLIVFFAVVGYAVYLF
ncbi:hypothetical protein P4S84_16735, partial [Aneurinibacillus aneurinilyticus]|nr:hypothetical protein [Aneurinibacillus aneurinilyticus]